ncbi:MAG TPA: glycoside hydrolase family 3 N-terminal domain-containing protein [Anaerolineaceae bacterium]|nr:glycoside hydrolase family 3 N-terminal domain-containing protein [Anaerolineaceae bacterium]
MIARRTLLLLTLAALLTAVLYPSGRAVAQLDDPQLRAQTLLTQLTPQEKVGQLFLVTFDGLNVDADSQIYDLIVNQHVGGVVLSADNDNFTGPEGTSIAARNLITALQTGAADTTGTYIPLFVGVSQEGDLAPYDEIFNDLTPLPNLMAIGATWKPPLAQQVGTVMGRELEALGFNLYLGPSLDVLDVLRSETSDDLGTRTFGGDPYWVGEMGAAYINGLHTGSRNRLAVIAKHFPGRGGSDRPPEEEVATVRKSLESLKQIELAPFFAVTGKAPDAASTTDGLLVSHIRYQGFQGNIRATTRPVSLDAAALEQILTLPELAVWRDNMGVIVSDDLGSQAVRRFYDPTGRTFDARAVARSAFLAGNDLLYVDEFTATGDLDSYTTLLSTLASFTQKYREDTAFAERVDASVERILTLKFRLYDEFTLNEVLPAADSLPLVGQAQTVSFEVARQSVTLLSPTAAQLSLDLPRPPNANDRILFLTDTYNARACSNCPEQTLLGVSDLQLAVQRLYGPQGGGQISASRLYSYSFKDLKALLDDPLAQPVLQTDLQSANWVVVMMLGEDADRPASAAFRQMLSQRPDLLSGRHVIVFALNAPYYLDATDISVLTAYYGLYSKSPDFVNVAARILFQEISPTGALPVTVPGVGYDLIESTSPDPAQVIPLYLDLPAATATPNTTGTPEPTPAPSYLIGDTIPLRTGLILDRNRHMVPDGTVVRFVFELGGETTTTQQIETVTEQGVAHASYRIQSAGALQIRVISDPAYSSDIIQLNVAENQGAVPTVLVATLEPSVTPTLEPTATPSPTPEAPPVAEPPSGLTGLHWLLAAALSWGGAAAIYALARRRVSIRWGVRWALLSGLGGLLAYLLLLILSRGSPGWLGSARLGATVGFTLPGVLLGWLAGWIWQQIMRRRQP